MGDERFDGLFMNAVQQSQGIDNFFDNLFGFMRRKTDFFTLEDKSKTMVVAHLERHAKAFADDKVRHEMIARKKAQVAAEAQAKVDAAAAAHKNVQEEKEASDQCMEVTDEEAALIEAQEKAKKEGKPIPEAKPAEEKKEGADEDEDDESKGAKPNASNGGTCEKYNWGQTLDEVTVNVDLPEGTTGKMMNIVMTTKKLSVKIKGGATIMDGELFKAIKCDDSIWCIETEGTGKRFL